MLYCIPKQQLVEVHMSIEEYVTNFYFNSPYDGLLDNVLHVFEKLKTNKKIFKKGIDGEIVYEVECVDTFFGNESLSTIKKLRVSVYSRIGNYIAYDFDTKEPVGDIQMKGFGWVFPDTERKYRGKVLVVSSLPANRKKHDKRVSTMVA